MTTSRSLAVALMATLCASACSGTTQDQDSGPKPGGDKGLAHDGALADAPVDAAPGEAAPSCGPGIYPCGPYGTQIGDTAADQQFVGFADPDELCASNKTKALDLTSPASLAFNQWYTGSEACPAVMRKLLWVAVGSAWDGAAKLAAQALQQGYSDGTLPDEVGVLYVLLETDTWAPATEAFAKTWINALNISYPVAIDPAGQMTAYFDKAQVPFHLLIDVATMKIYYEQAGGDIVSVSSKVQDFLAAHP